MKPSAIDRAEKMKEPCSEAAAAQVVLPVPECVVSRTSDREKRVQPTIRAGKDL
jgi:hypothetical protein